MVTEKKRIYVIGYFAYLGNPEIDQMFTPYVWGPTGLATLLKPLKGKNYGDKLKLLLIEYYIEEQLVKEHVREMRLLNYSAKNKDISVQVSVKSSDFHIQTDRQRREFLLESTLQAIELVRNRLERRKLNIDFDHLKRDVEAIGNKFIFMARE